MKECELVQRNRALIDELNKLTAENDALKKASRVAMDNGNDVQTRCIEVLKREIERLKQSNIIGQHHTESQIRAMANLRETNKALREENGALRKAYEKLSKEKAVNITVNINGDIEAEEERIGDIQKAIFKSICSGKPE